MVVILSCCKIGYGIKLKVSKSKYKIGYYFMGSTLIFWAFVYKYFKIYKYIKLPFFTPTVRRF